VGTTLLVYPFPVSRLFRRLAISREVLADVADEDPFGDGAALVVAFDEKAVHRELLVAQ
jgi:hypothetical protein